MDIPKVAIALVAGLAVACASSGGARSGRGTIAGPPENYPGFTRTVQYGNAWAEATFYTDYEDIFDTDLIGREDVIPVALKLGLRGEGQETSTLRVTPEHMNLRLYLEDGTVLYAMPFDQVAPKRRTTRERVTEEALKTDLLKLWDNAEEGFVFFRIAPEKEFDVDDTTITHVHDGIGRQLELTESLLAFQLTTDEGTAPIYVGIKTDRRRSSR